ncbi:MAG: hypothetical protein COB67_01830 [SAR324 cluster bacterium]|uniref:histidine kinase n=1 Tax=SAR324 cluster bacterium TaxID=2024889 RepID=A0A2A4TAM8_9DELT|nr:MAG: hypothetical protein COB67_01830 [SAR324 cluster bacterium]
MENLEILLQNSNQGFLAFDKNGKVQPDFAETTQRFFEKPLVGEDALKVLFQWGTPSNVNAAGFQSDQDLGMLQDLLETVFLRITDLDVLTELLPNELLLTHHAFSLAYQYIQSPQSMDEDRILVIMTDISKEKELADRITLEEERSEMILKVAMDATGYFQFKETAIQLLEALQEELGKELETIQSTTILRCISALQSGAEVFEMNEIVHLLQGMLNVLEKQQLEEKKWEEEQLQFFQKQTDQVEACFELLHSKYLDSLLSDEQILDKAIYSVTETKIVQLKEQILDEVLNKKFDELDQVFEKNYTPFTKHPQLAQITKQRLERIKEFLWDEISPSCTQEISTLLDNLKKQPAKLILKKFALIAENLGKRMGKQVEVEVIGEELEIHYHRFEDLFSSLIHLLRNAVEHGLESMEERVFLGKSLEGKIRLEVRWEQDNFILKIEDDGRGIDLDKLKETIVRKKVLTEEEAAAASDEEILGMLFKVGYSTKGIVNGISGRGVGLDAVHGVVQALHGDIMIRSEQEKGTIITITVPADE